MFDPYILNASIIVAEIGVHRNTGTHQNTGTHLYLPKRTIDIVFSFTYVWFYDFIIICISFMCY